MSEPTDGAPITPGVKKQTKRFAPVKRGGKTAAAIKREAAAAAAVSAEGGESSSLHEPVSESSSSLKPASIGTIRPENANSGRLPSINDGQKTRGTSAKMKFKPTVPLKRNKKEVSSSAIDEALNKPQRSERGGRGGGRGGAGRGRGRGRGLILVDTSTASGIFSLGPSAVSRNRPGGYGGGGGGLASYGGDVPSRAEGEAENSDMVEMFTSSMDKDTPVTFRHISAQDSDIDPVTLEQTLHQVPWMRVKSKKAPKIDITEDEMMIDKVKKEGEDVDMDTLNDETKPKEEEEEDEIDTDKLSKIFMSSDAPAQNIFALDEKERLVCVAEEELLFFQLPMIVPQFEKSKEELDEDLTVEKREEGTEANELPPAAKKSSLEEAMNDMNLEDMPSGQVGKLVVYKSGKMKMRFGKVLLDINQGLQATFLENVMVVDHESEETKKAIELGHIVQKFVCIPNMDDLLTTEETEAQE